MKVTIFNVSCYGGTLISKHQAGWNNFCQSHCGLTLITATDSDSPAIAGGLAYDSPIEDFLEDGAEVDHDSDLRHGDLYDRFVEMINQQHNTPGWAQGIPQSFHCPEGGSWCSLDEPFDQPPEPEEPELSVTPSSIVFEHVIGVDPCPQLVGGLVVSNTGGGTLNWSLSSSIWFTFDVSSGSLGAGESAPVKVYFTCEGVEGPGTLQDTIVVNGRHPSTGEHVANSPVRINVVGLISEYGVEPPPEQNPPTIGASPKTINWEWRTGDPCPKIIANIQITNTGGGTLQWTKGPDDPSWLDIAPDSDTAPSVILVEYNCSITSPGTTHAWGYFGIVGWDKVTFEPATNNPVQITHDGYIYNIQDGGGE